MPMAVNFSRTTLAFPEVADRLEEIRQKFDIPAELLQVEITETASTEDYRTFQKVVDSIRAKGFRVAIDDFGVAYANLMILARLGFDELKLDKSLMDDLCGSDKRQRLLRLVIEAAEDMGIRTVAEGVETRNSWLSCANWAVPGPELSAQPAAPGGTVRRPAVLTGSAKSRRKGLAFLWSSAS